MNDDNTAKCAYLPCYLSKIKFLLNVGSDIPKGICVPYGCNTAESPSSVKESVLSGKTRHLQITACQLQDSGISFIITTCYVLSACNLPGENSSSGLLNLSMTNPFHSHGIICLMCIIYTGHRFSCFAVSMGQKVCV